MEVPPTRYVLTEDGVRIGWTTFGVGPAVLRVANPPFGSVSGETRSLLPKTMEQTAASATWFHYDACGTGRSRWTAAAILGVDDPEAEWARVREEGTLPEGTAK